jgi:ATP-dependent Clp protease ATP-binding subunit ClpA
MLLELPFANFGGIMRYHLQTEALLRNCAGKARSLGHSYVGSAHLLLTMSAETDSMGLMLRQLGMDPQLTEAMVQLMYGVGTPDLPLPQGLTEEVRRLLRMAAREAEQQKCREIQPYHILLAMARKEENAAMELLQLNGISTDTLFTHTMDYLRWERQTAVKGKKEAVSTRLLEQFSEDLIAKAQAAAEDYCRVTFPDDAPESVRLAVLLMTSHYYENRENSDSVAYATMRTAFQNLLYPHRDPDQMF